MRTKILTHTVADSTHSMKPCGLSSATVSASPVNKTLPHTHFLAIRAINADKSIRAAIIIGSGKAFCAGIDTAYAASIIRSECDDVVERTRQLNHFIEVGGGIAIESTSFKSSISPRSTLFRLFRAAKYPS